MGNGKVGGSLNLKSVAIGAGGVVALAAAAYGVVKLVKWLRKPKAEKPVEVVSEVKAS